MAEQRIDVIQELREQNIDVLSANTEQAINIGREPSVLHGIDGVSPIATVTQTETGATISITDRNGTTTADITNGQDGERGERGATGATGATGPAGSDGQDGFSPIATVTKSGKVATITITDKNGTTTQTISDGNDGQNGSDGAAGRDGRDGQDGADGFSPTATVVKSGDTATITITDKNGTTTAQISDGAGASITVDDELSSSSTNPVQNKVINSALSAKADSSDIPTKTSDLTNDGATGTSTYVESDDLATVATSGSYNDLTDKPSITPELVEMSYGESNAWAKFIAAYQAHCIVYCRASSNANPATGSQTRKAFMAYVDNATNPTNVEFQYVRSVNVKSDSQQGDQVFVYKLTSSGAWSVTARNSFSKVVAGTNMTSSYANGTITLNATQPTVPTKTSGLTNDGSDGNSTYVEADELATVATTGSYDDLTNKPTIPTAGTITSGSTGYATGGDVYNAIGNVETILSTLNNGGGAQ